jgi:predicted acyl esterase
MRGISYGAFTALQAAAKAPVALKAIVSTCGTEQRYLDDIHCKGGCLINDQLVWTDSVGRKDGEFRTLDTLVQLFCLSSSGLIGRRYEYERTRISRSALFIGIGVVNEQRTNRAEEL